MNNMVKIRKLAGRMGTRASFSAQHIDPVHNPFIKFKSLTHGIVNAIAAL